MSARVMLRRLADAGVELKASGDRLRYRGPAGVLTAEVMAELRERKPELLKLLRSPAYRALRPARDGTAAELLERFMTDAEIPLAILHSRALGRDFALARDPEATALLTGAERSLPVLYMTDCARVATLGLEGLRVLLDLRERFGPEVALYSVRPRGSVQ